ncbi:MAG: Type 1 glutamine amidotransferase-like domain-containing protein, partial [Acidobacteria bacterium]|nr:Type 1 glutamine amidotransferase-like domain-containing protein [Acidobacteriota bacterium]
QINPHYLDPDPGSTHMGETREKRIAEFHEMNDAPVLGMREGSLLRVNDDEMRLWGRKGARLFRKGEEPLELQPGDVIPSMSSRTE